MWWKCRSVSVRLRYTISLLRGDNNFESRWKGEKFPFKVYIGRRRLKEIIKVISNCLCLIYKWDITNCNWSDYFLWLIKQFIFPFRFVHQYIQPFQFKSRVNDVDEISDTRTYDVRYMRERRLLAFRTYNISVSRKKLRKNVIDIVRRKLIHLHWTE